jgi:hypothetical protein
MNGRIFVPGEADESNLSLLFGGGESLGRTIGRENQVGVVVVNHFVNLP